jgi:hypothetical protein
MRNFRLTLILFISFSGLAQKAGIKTTLPMTTLNAIYLSRDDAFRVEGFVSFHNTDSTVLVVDPTSAEVRYMSYDSLSKRITVGSSQVISVLINNADKLLSKTTFVTNLYTIIKDSLLIHINYLNILRDSIETLTVINNTDSKISYVDELGNTTVLDVKSMIESMSGFFTEKYRVVSPVTF